MLRKYLFNQVGPFDKTYALAIDIVFEANLVHLFYIADPVDIKMIEGQTPFLIYLHNGKCRAAYRLLDAKPRCQPFRKYSFAYSQICLLYTSRCV